MQGIAAILRLRDRRTLSLQLPTSVLSTFEPSIFIVVAMVSPVPHTKCGFYTLACTSDPQQVIYCGLTGENAMIERSPEMIAASEYYVLSFTDDGWAYVEDRFNDVKHWVSNMNFRKRPVQNTGGRIAIQDKLKEWKPYWIDNPDDLNKKTTRTLELEGGKKLTFTEFSVSRAILSSALSLPCRLGGKVFWEVRCVQNGLDSGEVDDDNLATWTKRNFHNAKDMWGEKFSQVGGEHGHAHWFTSQSSWELTQKVTSVYIRIFVLTQLTWSTYLKILRHRLRRVMLLWLALLGRTSWSTSVALLNLFCFP